VVLWFRGTDLRVHDNAPVARAAQLVRAAGFAGAEVLPVFCFDPRHFWTQHFGRPKTGAFRAKFLRESVVCLRENLEGLGSASWCTMACPNWSCPRWCIRHSQLPC